MARPLRMISFFRVADKIDWLIDRNMSKRELGWSGVDVAWYLGDDNSCLTRLISAGQVADVDDIDLEL